MQKKANKKIQLIPWTRGIEIILLPFFFKFQNLKFLAVEQFQDEAVPSALKFQKYPLNARFFNF